MSVAVTPSWVYSHAVNVVFALIVVLAAVVAAFSETMEQVSTTVTDKLHSLQGVVRTTTCVALD